MLRAGVINAVRGESFYTPKREIEIMAEIDSNVEFLGEPCGHHGAYTFYRGIRYQIGNKWHKLLLGKFFHASIDSKSSRASKTLNLIGELQLVWEDRNHEGEKLSSVRLYIVPEDCPQGRQPHHGQDEILAEDEKVVLRVRDLVRLVATGPVRWTKGLLAVGRGPSNIKSNPEQSGTVHNNQPNQCKSNCKDCTKETPSSTSSTQVVILSYPHYCRYRAALKRLEQCSGGLSAEFLEHLVGRLTTRSSDTRIMFCRDTVELPELQNYEHRMNHLAPSLKGRKRKKRQMSLSRAGIESEDSNESEETNSEKCVTRSVENNHDQAEIKPDDEECKKSLPCKRMKLNSTEDQLKRDEKKFLKRLHKFMNNINCPISRIPTLGFKEVDLYKFYVCTQSLGGYDQVTEKKLWKLVYDQLGGSAGNTSAATGTRKNYEKLLLPFERHSNGTENKVKKKKKKKAKKLNAPDGIPSEEISENPCGIVISDVKKESADAENLNENQASSVAKDVVGVEPTTLVEKPSQDPSEENNLQNLKALKKENLNTVIKQETVENKPIDMIRCESKLSSNESCAYDDADVIIVEDGFLESPKVKKETSVIEKSRMKSSEIVNDWLNDNYKSMVADQRAAAAAAPSHTMTSDDMTDLPKLVNADNSSVLNLNLGKSDLATKYFSNANMKYPPKPVCATETLASLQTPFSHFDGATLNSPNSSVKANLESVSMSPTAVTKSSISRKLLSGGQALFAPATSEKQESPNNFSNLAGFSSSNIGKLEIVKLALADKLASSTQKRSISSSLQQSRPTVLQHTLHRGPSSPAHKIPPQVFPGQATSISPAHADVMPSFLAGTPLEQPPFQGPSSITSAAKHFRVPTSAPLPAHMKHVKSPWLSQDFQSDSSITKRPRLNSLNQDNGYLPINSKCTFSSPIKQFLEKTQNNAFQNASLSDDQPTDLSMKTTKAREQMKTTTCTVQVEDQDQPLDLSKSSDDRFNRKVAIKAESTPESPTLQHPRNYVNGFVSTQLGPSSSIASSFMPLTQFLSPVICPSVGLSVPRSTEGIQLTPRGLTQLMPVAFTPFHPAFPIFQTTGLPSAARPNGSVLYSPTSPLALPVVPVVAVDNVSMKPSPLQQTYSSFANTVIK